jgi:hypothetical protein
MKLEYFAEEEGGGTPIVLYQVASSADVPVVKVEDTEGAAGECDSPEEEEEGIQFVKVEGAEDAGDTEDAVVACDSPEEEEEGIQFVKVEGGEDAGVCESPEEEKWDDSPIQSVKSQSYL